ncbi:MAG TPA: hypothetical protein PKI19_14545 [Elusimicrobiales bacterium]|nr:hypothetical protein [Elusimicrobiales bacterium]
MEKEQLPVALEFLSTMAEAETAVSGFYSACLADWPAEDLWKTLAEQELGHAAAALRIRELVAAAPAEFQVARLVNIKGVDLFIAGVKSSTEKARRKIYSLKQALAAARDIEQSILESRYDQFFSSGNAEYKALIDGIMADTRGHKEQINVRLAYLNLVK